MGAITWKRKMINTETVLYACQRSHFDKEERNSAQIIMEETGAPEKVVLAAMEREDDNGNIEYGVSLRTAFLTTKGEEKLFEYRIKDIIK